MKSVSAEALTQYLIEIADDELILAHRDSEWAGHAPILEEDIAFANIALDEMGHAVAWYRLAGELQGKSNEDYPDQMVFQRRADEFRNAQMMELPNGDWAFSLVRQYLFDSLETVRLKELANSEWSPLAVTAAKIRPEELYHSRHTKAWVLRLGLGTDESNQRMQRALDDLFPYALQLFTSASEEEGKGEDLRKAWEAEIRPVITESNLRLPQVDEPPAIGRDEHTPHLIELVEDMQEVARLETGAQW